MPNNVNHDTEAKLSRSEQILKSIVDGIEYTDKPKSRIEYWLIKLKDAIEGGGSSTDYATSLSLSLNTITYVLTAQLLNKNGDPLGTAQTIDLPLESTVVGGSYNSQAKTLILTLVSGQTINIPIGDIISGLQTEITAQNPLSSDLIDDTNATHKFVTAAEKTQIATNASDIADIQNTIGNINSVLEEVL